MRGTEPGQPVRPLDASLDMVGPMPAGVFGLDLEDAGGEIFGYLRPDGAGKRRPSA